MPICAHRYNFNWKVSLPFGESLNHCNLMFYFESFRRKKLEDELKIKQAEEALAKKKAIAEAEKV